MAMSNPVGRANYEPNSWGDEGGPRENPDLGFTSFEAPVEGVKQRLRSDTFSDHYSQARQFYLSQLPIEQKHIADALVFELSKVTRVGIRSRSVSHLRNIDELLASKVADGLGINLPDAAKAAKPTLDMPTSDALSILGNGPNSFKGRKLGIMLTDGSSAKLVAAVTKSIEAVGGVWEIIASKIGGVTLDDGSTMAAKQKIDGGPSVLYDAVAILPSDEGAMLLASDAAAKDFVSDAFAHCKFIGHNPEANALFEKARIPAKLDAGFIDLASGNAAKAFTDELSTLRFWERELTVDLDA